MKTAKLKLVGVNPSQKINTPSTLLFSGGVKMLLWDSDIVDKLKIGEMYSIFYIESVFKGEQQKTIKSIKEIKDIERKERILRRMSLLSSATRLLQNSADIEDTQKIAEKAIYVAMLFEKWVMTE